MQSQSPDAEWQMSSIAQSTSCSVWNWLARGDMMVRQSGPVRGRSDGASPFNPCQEPQYEPTGAWASTRTTADRIHCYERGSGEAAHDAYTAGGRRGASSYHARSRLRSSHCASSASSMRRLAAAGRAAESLTAPDFRRPLDGWQFPGIGRADRRPHRKNTLGS